MRRTMQSQTTQVWHQIVRATRVNAIPIGNNVKMIYHVEKRRARLMNSADNSTSLLC